MKAIVVLGSRIPGKEIHKELKLRLDVAIDSFDDGSVLVLSGGYTNKDLDRSEASFMSDYCISKGIPQDKIVQEEKSLDTIGNGYFIRSLIDELPGITEVEVVSSCYHMKRSEYIFRACFDNKYALDFSHCCDFYREDISETKSIDMAKVFFSGIIPGDIDAIGKRLYKEHLLYLEDTNSPKVR